MSDLNNKFKEFIESVLNSGQTSKEDFNNNPYEDTYTSYPGMGNPRIKVIDLGTFDSKEDMINKIDQVIKNGGSGFMGGSEEYYEGKDTPFIDKGYPNDTASITFQVKGSFSEQFINHVRDIVNDDYEEAKNQGCDITMISSTTIQNNGPDEKSIFDHNIH